MDPAERSGMAATRPCLWVGNHPLGAALHPAWARAGGLRAPDWGAGDPASAAGRRRAVAKLSPQRLRTGARPPADPQRLVEAATDRPPAHQCAERRLEGERP